MCVGDLSQEIERRHLLSSEEHLDFRAWPTWPTGDYRVKTVFSIVCTPLRLRLFLWIRGRVSQAESEARRVKTFAQDEP